MILTAASFARMYRRRAIPRGDGKEALEGHRGSGQSGLHGAICAGNLEVSMTYALYRNMISEILPR